MRRALPLLVARLWSRRIAHGCPCDRPATNVDRDAATKLDAFKRQYRKLDHVCDVDSVTIDLLDGGAPERLAEMGQTPGELVTYAMCLEHGGQAADADNFRLGVETARRTPARATQVLAYQSSRSGFASLLDHGTASDEVAQRVWPFGMVEDAFTWDTIVHETLDELARAIHDDYHRRRLLEGQVAMAGPEWEYLSDELRDSNRGAADHIPIKLRAVGLHHEPSRPGGPAVESFTREQTLLLAKMEHLRWCAERWLGGWESAPVSDRARKLNRDLVKWDDLENEERKKDPEQIRAIPDVLGQIGHAIYR